MAKKDKGDGPTIRAVTSGPTVTHDEFIDFAEARNKEDRARSESAGTSREKIGAFLEKTNLNSQAASWGRSILKKADTAKAMDVIMSLKAILPMVEAHVTGQGTPDMFSAPKAPSYQPDATFEEGDAPEPVDEADLPDDLRDDLDDIGVTDPELAADADDFDKHLAEVYPETAA